MNVEQIEELYSIAGISRRFNAAPLTVKAVITKAGITPFGIVHRGLSPPADIFTRAQVDLMEELFHNRAAARATLQTIL